MNLPIDIVKYIYKLIHIDLTSKINKEYNDLLLKTWNCSHCQCINFDLTNSEKYQRSYFQFNFRGGGSPWSDVISNINNFEEYPLPERYRYSLVK